MGMFKQAIREKLKARITIEGPAGCGKSYTALRWAPALAGGGRIAVIDTEHRSATKYIGETPDGHPWAFDVCNLEHFSPVTYTNVIRQAGKDGYAVLVIDSLSHAWEGVGGALDTVDRKSSEKGSNNFTAWREVSPQHREMIEAMLSSPCHLITTMRTKTAYELKEVEREGKKKMAVEKIGTKPVQREGMEYEFDLVCDMDLDHLLTVSKTRCSAMDGARAVKPGPEFVRPFAEWLALGQAPPPAVPVGIRLSGVVPPDPYSAANTDPCGEGIANAIKEAARTLEMDPEKLRELAGRCGVNRVAEIPYKDAMALLVRLQAKVAGIPF